MTVNALTLLARQIHGREAIDAIGNGTVMAAIRALDHQVRRNDTALPGGGDRGCNLIPTITVNLGDRTGIGTDFNGDGN